MAASTIFRGAAHKLFVRLSPDAQIMIAVGTAAAVIQTLLIREVFAVVSGNELVVGTMLAIWLAATAAGSALGGRCNIGPRLLNILLIGVLLSCSAGIVGMRAVRLLLMPGEALAPQQLLPLLLFAEAPVAFCGGFLFGALVKRSEGANVYRWEQLGALAGLSGLSIAVAYLAPNLPIAAAVLIPIALLLRGWVWRISAAVLLTCFVLSDHPTSGWKYPLPVAEIVYAREGEVARATVDGEQITYVNGALYATTYTVPAVEQAVHTPLGMHPFLRDVLIVNNAGHLAEARKYPGADVRCIRTDRLISDTCCPYGRLESAERWRPFDAVLLGCGMPDNIASSRFFTKSFYKRMHTLVGDSGIFSFTLPLHSEYTGGQDRVVRDIVVATLGSVFRYVKVLPGEGLTFTASDADYPLPGSCRVPNDYYTTTVLAALTPEKIGAANEPPKQIAINTAAHPRLLLAALDRYLQQFKIAWWMVVALPVLLVAGLVSLVRPSMSGLSVGSSGFCIGVFTVAMMMLYQSAYGTLYAGLSMLLLSLSAGFTAGCFVRKFPVSDMTIGVFTGGGLLALAQLGSPPAPLFYFANAAAGFLASAQFVTRRGTPASMLYAADCAGGVLGMSLASTVLIPLFGMGVVAAGMVVVKVGVGLVAAGERKM